MISSKIRKLFIAILDTKKCFLGDYFHPVYWNAALSILHQTHAHIMEGLLLGTKVLLLQLDVVVKDISIYIGDSKGCSP